MEKYLCDLCGYQYNPAIGDPEGNIPVGMAFEDIPDTWRCPLCETLKTSFVKI